jgi:hypothetical protein
LKLGKYIFVSCWTKEDAENVALWGLYTQNKGIRITLDEDMFITYPVNEKCKSFFPYFIEFGSDYFITCANNNTKLIDINYVDDLNLKIKNLGNYIENPSDHKFELFFSNDFAFQDIDEVFCQIQISRITSSPVHFNHAHIVRRTYGISCQFGRRRRHEMSEIIGFKI